MLKSSDIAGQTTGIGSLPPDSEKGVLDRAFSLDIPFFPSLPARGEGESLFGQGLAGFPERGPRDESPGLLWDAYLARLAADPRPWAKIQLLGPATASLAPGAKPEASSRREDWLLGRAEFLLESVQALGKSAIFFWDEPALLEIEDRTGLQAMSEALRGRGARVGLHCCAAGDLSFLLDWPLDFLSFDVSLASAWEDEERLGAFRRRGGALALGVVPTAPTSAWHPGKEVERCRSRLRAALGAREGEAVLRESLLTPACGLGLRTEAESDAVFAALREFQDCLQKG